MKYVIIPASVTSIGANAFSDCSSLRAVYLLGDVPSTGGDIYSGTPADLITYVPVGSTGWIFPNFSALPEKWPTEDGDNGRNIENGSPVWVSMQFYPNGGELTSVISNITQLAGIKIGALPVPMREGYTFLGWWTAENGGERITADAMADSTITTLYAHWAEGMAFVSGGNADWTQETDGSWRSGTIGASQTTWMETTVYGEGEFSFRWKVSSESGWDNLTFSIDGAVKDTISGNVGWTDKTVVISGKKSHTIRFAYSKDGSVNSGSDCGWVDAVAWMPYVECTITFDANGGTMLESSLSAIKGHAIGELPVPSKTGFLFDGWWTADGVLVMSDTVVDNPMTLTAKWVRNPFNGGTGWSQDSDGNWESGETAHNATNSISMTVSGPGTVSFNWKVSCEDFYRIYRLDYLAFFIDGIEQGFINGETGWKSETFEVSGSGAHTLVWSYIKDSEGVAGKDCAWLDEVVWTPAVSTDLTVDVGEGKSVVVPTEWIDKYDSFVTAAGGDKAVALQQTAANGRKVWECFMLGVDPTKADDDFKITRFWMEGGKPMFEFSHSADGVGNSFEPRIKVKGKAKLSDGWSDVPEGGNSTFRFFTVEVALP